ncbi:MAG: B12-binding domain-containing radical SAM protein, partial [Treponema sp.]|nr:B12-binding domain-containing radical SAM protein [Treponema sp.]
MPDILLVTINAKWIHPSLALRLLKANLGSLEERAVIMEFALRQPLAEKTVPILRARPRVRAVSVSIWNHLATLELFAALNESWEREPAGKPVIVLGGPEVSWLDEGAAILRHADWVIRGEGEPAFRELCGLLLESETPLGPEERKQWQTELVLRLAAKGGIRAAKGKFIEAGKAGPEAVKSAYRLYTKEDLERKLVYVESSRGCPFGCEFCLSSLDRQVREFPLEPFLAEMGDLIEKGARRFKFLDRTFNINPERAARILEFFLDKMQEMQGPPAPGAGGPVCVHFEIVPSHLPKELRGLLARFKPGTLRLELGIQTFNPVTASLVGRASNPERELETLDFLCRNTNAIIHADLIAGLPGEDIASFANGFDRLWQALSVRNTGYGKGSGSAAALTEKPRTEIQLGILKRLPGTPIARHDKTFAMRYAADPPYEV